MSRQHTFDSVVIGAGLGGLTCAAHLARGGRQVLVLEKGAHVGGQCATRDIEGVRYIVGANGFGAGAQRAVRELGRPLEAIPSKSRLLLGDIDLQMPSGLMRERTRLGLSALQLAGTLWRMTRAAKRLPEGARTFEDVIAHVAPPSQMREIFHLFASLVGAPASALPAEHWHAMFAAAYGYDATWYPAAGAQAIPEAFAEVVRAAGGEIRLGQGVESIAVEGGVATGVVAGGEWIGAREAVVSNAEIRATLALLGDAAPRELADDLRDRRRSLSLATLLLLVDEGSPAMKKMPMRRGAAATVTLCEDGVCGPMAALDEGRLPDRPILNVALAQAIAQGERPQPRAVSVIIPWPRGGIGAEAEAAFVDHALARMERYFGALKLLRRELVTPERYEARFGFPSCTAPLQETPGFEKPGRALPVGRLFNVGSTVQPRGTHAGAAIESGRLCAREILAAAG